MDATHESSVCSAVFNCSSSTILACRRSTPTLVTICWRSLNNAMADVQLITSQFPVDKWHGIIGDPTYADAILDRIVHNAHRIVLTGESLRKKRKPVASEKTS